MNDTASSETANDSSLIEFPVNVSQSEDGGYVARLVDLPEGVEGRGVDPYAALEDLSARAQDALARLHHNKALPVASAIEDRPTIKFDPDAVPAALGITASLSVSDVKQNEMLGYCWTNHTIFQDR